MTSCRYCRFTIRNDGGDWRLLDADMEEEGNTDDPFACPDSAAGHAPKVERDEVLMAEVRDQYQDLGLDPDQVAAAMSAARDAGVFGVA